MQDPQKQYGVLVLAAGKSSRLGRPKQSLTFEGVALLSAAVKKAMDLQCGPIAVVLGAGADELRPLCAPAMVVYNEQWQHGMAGSIAIGVEFLCSKFPHLCGVIITVCDQPYMTTTLLRQLIQTHETTGLPMVAARYAGRPGTPAFFHHTTFTSLMQLTGDKGAKTYIESNLEKVAWIDFPLGVEDIDTPEDYKRLLKTEKHDYRLP